eukprot:CAMPEP_0194070434 /NCGR_PEP_ID=MMETSP0009_2-20130614/88176_1 /TAXON_ID=210454 /ORGANISM="Grammatophora oceanica, Strain CCMP 410" /LENGTH=558 /DNA_ID=CAMNT_0038723703 /DNA_START=82 /DNA_END=1758 /DNA_ORIENTATION=+
MRYRVPHPIPFAAYLFVSATTVFVGATPAWPNGWTATQPDDTTTRGTQVLVGTPSYHFTVIETSDSYFVTIKDHTDDYIKYATIDETTGRFVPTEFIVGQADPADLPEIQPGLVEDADIVRQKCMENSYCKWHAENNGKAASAAPKGDLKNLLIPVRFAGHEHRGLGIHVLSRELFNDDDLSVNHFFQQNSYGKVSSLTSVLSDEVQLSKTETECADNKSGLSEKLHECYAEALESSGADPSQYDTVSFIHSGYGAEFGDQDEDGTYFDDRIWSHAWEMEMGGTRRLYATFSAYWGTANLRGTRVGVPVHEIAQTLGAPTMYGDGMGYGLGYYDVMASPWGFDGMAWHCASMSAYTKMILEWAEVEEISSNSKKTLFDSTESSKVYKISHGFPNPGLEYLLLENRRPKDYDTGMRGPGIAVYHVDLTANDLAGKPSDGVWPKNHYRVALVQADGRFDLERLEDEGDIGDLFYKDNMFAAGDNTLSDEGAASEEGKSHSGHPNVKSYAGGKEVKSGITISEISDPADEMSFFVEFEDIQEEGGDDSRRSLRRASINEQK